MYCMYVYIYIYIYMCKGDTSNSSPERVGVRRSKARLTVSEVRDAGIFALQGLGLWGVGCFVATLGIVMLLQARGLARVS